MKLCILMMGIPGSGKSHTVKKIEEYYKNKNIEVIVCSSDHFMVNDEGKYDFHQNKLAFTHRKCQEKFCNSLLKNNVVVIVDNTNVKIKDIRYYETMATKQSAIVLFMESDSTWKDNVNECFERNTHNVPYEKIKEMHTNLLHTRKTLLDEGKIITNLNILFTKEVYV